MDTSLKTDHAPVLLPRTDFHGRHDPGAEQRVFASWEASNHAARVHAACAGKPPFLLHDGPPYANGDAHAGHAVNRFLKDTTVRLQRMLGRDAVLLPGA